jgi:hypothetical protein
MRKFSLKASNLELDLFLHLNENSHLHFKIEDYPRIPGKSDSTFPYTF